MGVLRVSAPASPRTTIRVDEDEMRIVVRIRLQVVLASRGLTTLGRAKGGKFLARRGGGGEGTFWYLSEDAQLVNVPRCPFSD